MQSKIQEFFNVSPDYIVGSIEGTNISQNIENQHVTWCYILQLLSIRESKETLDVVCNKKY